MRIRKAPKTEMVYLLLKDKIIRGGFADGVGGILGLDAGVGSESSVKYFRNPYEFAAVAASYHFPAGTPARSGTFRQSDPAGKPAAARNHR